MIFLTILAFDQPTPVHLATWTMGLLAGPVIWTLIEYFLHRFVFHRAPIIAEIHDRHHRRPMELIGAPAWSSFVLALIGVMLPLSLLVGFQLAVGVTSGIVCGYLWYVLVHYASHHWHPRHGTYLYRVRVRHARHHYAAEEGNYGVTTDLWDRLFGTVLEPRKRTA